MPIHVAGGLGSIRCRATQVLGGAAIDAPDFTAREILKECLLRGAGGFVLFHTHPSGDPTPSAEDLLFTRRMADAAAVVGVELVDHLVLGSTARWVSLRERGGW